MAATSLGVRLLVGRRFETAQRQSEAALQRDETPAEAHNSFAYSLRMPGNEHWGVSLAAR